IIANYLQSANLLGDAVQSFHDNCVIGIEPDTKKITENLQNSLMLVTALTPQIGYERAAQIAKAAHHKGTTLKEEALKVVNVSEEQLEQWLDPEQMLGTAS
ncbi:MAG: class II fumarate hydratase, partial [Desulfopila sp.]